MTIHPEVAKISPYDRLSVLRALQMEMRKFWYTRDVKAIRAVQDYYKSLDWLVKYDPAGKLTF